MGRNGTEHGKEPYYEASDLTPIVSLLENHPQGEGWGLSGISGQIPPLQPGSLKSEGSCGLGLRSCLSFFN